jgi:MSHA pilin protein MshD
MSTRPGPSRQRGLSLIELVLFIVIVAVGLAGILAVLNNTTRRSADPLPIKQAVAIAEALLDEVQLAAFTWCDPDDANVLTATSAAVSATGCATAAGVEGIGPEAGDARPFDNVSDYNGFAMAGITDLTGAAITGLAAYSASVTVAAAALGAVPAGAALLITVTVTGPGNTSVSLSGYRTRYAPNSIP